MLVEAFPLVLLRWEDHDVEREREVRPPLGDVSYCDVYLVDDGDVWEVKRIVGLAAAGIVEGSNPASRVVVRRFPLLERKD